jgi:hypothetical protein
MRAAHAILLTVSLFLVGASLLSEPAEARGYRASYIGERHASNLDGRRYAPVIGARHHAASLGGRRHASSLGGRPARWCGWWMRTQKGGGPELNLARNWAKWGRPSGPQVGAVVVWSHHVGMITGRTASGWIVKSGNDGGRVRERVRSVAGAVFRVG